MTTAVHTELLLHKDIIANGGCFFPNLRPVLNRFVLCASGLFTSANFTGPRQSLDYTRSDRLQDLLLNHEGCD